MNAVFDGELSVLYKKPAKLKLRSCYCQILVSRQALVDPVFLLNSVL